MNIAIATDTNSGMTQEMLLPGMYLLPMPVIVDGKTHEEGVDITNQQLYEAMRQHKDLSSSQPAPGRILGLWDSILSAGYEEIVYIPMSSGLSGACANAALFAEPYGGRVQVVDNHRISVPQMESVFAAHRLAGQGLPAKEIKAQLEARAYDASIYITVDSLDYLKKGGRITPAVAAFAEILNLKPVLTIQGDKLDTFAKVRGIRQAEARMIDAVKQDRVSRFGGVPDGQLQVETAGTFVQAADAQRWREQVQAEFPEMQVSYVDLPCSIACHVGMNAAAVGIIQKTL